jgi:hypothetical protein
LTLLSPAPSDGRRIGPSTVEFLADASCVHEGIIVIVIVIVSGRLEQASFSSLLVAGAENEEEPRPRARLFSIFSS